MMMSLRPPLSALYRSLASALLLLLLCLALPAQQTAAQPQTSGKPADTTTQSRPADQQSGTPTFSSDVKVVNVLATVRDKQGKIISSLTKDDFKLEQDGKPETIRYFTKETDLPLTLGLLVDTSLSQRRVINQERIASYGFLNDLMRPEKDKAFVLHFDWGTELLQDLTASHQKLEAALDKLDMPQFESSGQGGRPNGGSTTLYDAVFLAAEDLMQKQQGRKAVILLTDGVDQGSKVSLNRAIESAQRANTLVYCILYADSDAYAQPVFRHGGHHGGWGGPGGGGYPPPQQTDPADGKKVLQRMARETGGRFFQVSKKEAISDIYAQIEEELRNQYNLGFTPDKAAATPGYHKMSLTTTDKDLIVQTREGYYVQE